jgi:Ca2+-transporting ATPase
MSSIHESRIGLRKRIAVKGDPIQLLYKCDRVMRADGSMVPLDEATRARLLGINDGMAGRGLRVLGFAFADGEEIAEDALIWTGMAGLKSPVMAGAKELLARLHRAGIRPVMITGDQSATAEAIAREIGLTEERPVRVLDSVALSRLPGEVLDAVVQHTDVFARVPPSQKLDIVRALQRSGQTVAMAGDGFNDALALKAADIAIAVGAGNATAARDVADIIVTGDDLNVIGDGIEQGRAILSNIRKSLHFMLATNLSEILIVFAESLSARDELETPLELLWLNLVTDILPGLGLALEPPERDIMTAPPRPREEAILRMPDLRHAVQEAAVIGASVLASHAFGLSRYGPGDRTRTVTFFSMVAAQLSHALTCRQDRFVALGGRALFGNHWLNAALAGSVALQAVPMLWPGLRRALGLAPVERAHLAAAGLSGLISFGANEALLALRSGRANASGERHDA